MGVACKNFRALRTRLLKSPPFQNPRSAPALYHKKLVSGHQAIISLTVFRNTEEACVYLPLIVAGLHADIVYWLTYNYVQLQNVYIICTHSEAVLVFQLEQGIVHGFINFTLVIQRRSDKKLCGPVWVYLAKLWWSLWFFSTDKVIAREEEPYM